MTAQRSSERRDCPKYDACLYVAAQDDKYCVPCYCCDANPERQTLNENEGQCAICGGIFKFGKNKNQRFCSKNCANKSAYNRQIELALSKPVIPCPKCGKLFKKKSNLQKYCSPQCANIVREENRQKTRSTNVNL